MNVLVGCWWFVGVESEKGLIRFDREGSDSLPMLSMPKWTGPLDPRGQEGREKVLSLSKSQVVARLRSKR